MENICVGFMKVYKKGQVDVDVVFVAVVFGRSMKRY